MRGRRRAHLAKTRRRASHTDARSSTKRGKSYRIQQIELDIRSEPQGGRLELEGRRNATCSAREVGVSGRVRQAVLWQGWREGTHLPKLAHQLEPGSPAMAPTTMMKLPPRKSEDTCQGSAWRRAERSPPGTVERQNAHLGQDLSSSCWDARFEVKAHKQVRHGVGCKACCTGISRVQQVGLRATASRFE